MSIVWVQTAQTLGFGGTGTATMSSPTTTGNFLLGCAKYGNGNTSTANSWTDTASNTWDTSIPFFPGGDRGGPFWCGSMEMRFVVSCISNVADILSVANTTGVDLVAFSEYSGVATSSPFSSSGTASHVNDSTTAAVTLTGVPVGGLLGAMCWSWNGDITTITPGTVRVTSSGQFYGDYVSSSGGSVTITGGSDPTQSAMLVAAFKSGVVPPPPVKPTDVLFTGMT